MPSDASSLRDAGATFVSVVASAILWVGRAGKRLVERLSAGFRAAYRRSRALDGRLRSTARERFEGPVRRGLTGPVLTGAFGRRREVSLLVILAAIPASAVTAWWVGSTVGYATLEGWVRGTWYGTDPALAVFVGVAAVVGLGTVSAAVNSGFVPTATLVAAPVFGAALTRYGTEVPYGTGTTVVSLPNAVVVAASFAALLGVPLAACSFLLGSAVRRLVRVFDYRSGPPTNADEV